MTSEEGKAMARLLWSKTFIDINEVKLDSSFSYPQKLVIKFFPILLWTKLYMRNWGTAQSFFLLLLAEIPFLPGPCHNHYIDQDSLLITVLWWYSPCWGWNLPYNVPKAVLKITKLILFLQLAGYSQSLWEWFGPQLRKYLRGLQGIFLVLAFHPNYRKLLFVQWVFVNCL
jgi:hypothetical protein